MHLWKNEHQIGLEASCKTKVCRMCCNYTCQPARHKRPTNVKTLESLSSTFKTSTPNIGTERGSKHRSIVLCDVDNSMCVSAVQDSIIALSKSMEEQEENLEGRFMIAQYAEQDYTACKAFTNAPPTRKDNLPKERTCLSRTSPM